MDVVMKKMTYFNGKSLKVGDICYDLEDSVALRWSKNGIASIVESEFKNDEENANYPIKPSQDECKDGVCSAKIFDIDTEDEENYDEFGSDEEVMENGEQEEGQEKEMMKPKELFLLCKEKGLSPKPKMSREYYLELLEQEV